MQLTLKAARVNKGLTQEKAAELLGVTKDIVGNWERGLTYPNVIILKEIERVYEINYNDLIFLPRKYALSVKNNIQHKKAR